MEGFGPLSHQFGPGGLESQGLSFKIWDKLRRERDGEFKNDFPPLPPRRFP